MLTGLRPIKEVMGRNLVDRSGRLRYGGSGFCTMAMRSQGRCRGMRRPGPGRSARGKSREGLEFPGGALHSAAKIIVGVGVAAWKAGATRAYNSGGLTRGASVAEQFLGDAFIHDAPVRLWEAG